MVVPKQTLTSTTKLRTIPRQTIQIIKETEDLGLSSHPVRHVVEPITPHRKATVEQTQQVDRLPGIDDQKDKTQSSKEMYKPTQMGMSLAAAQTFNRKHHVFTPELHVLDRRQMNHQDFHQFPRLSGSNLRRPPLIKTT